MKALILSLVIAFSSSFALACQSAGGTIGNNEGKYTPRMKQEIHAAPAITVQGKSGKRTT